MSFFQNSPQALPSFTLLVQPWISRPRTLSSLVERDYDRHAGGPARYIAELFLEGFLFTSPCEHDAFEHEVQTRLPSRISGVLDDYCSRSPFTKCACRFTCSSFIRTLLSLFLVFAWRFLKIQRAPFSVPTWVSMNKDAISADTTGRCN